MNACMPRAGVTLLVLYALAGSPIVGVASGEDNWLRLVEVSTAQHGPAEEDVTGRVAISPNGQWVVASGRAVILYTRDAGTGKVEPIGQLEAGAKPAFSPDSRFLYVPMSFSELAVIELDRESSSFHEEQRVRDAKQGVTGMFAPSKLTVSADGKSLYVSSLHDQTLACFGIDPASGKLTFEECLQDDSAALPVGKAPRANARHVPSARVSDGVGLVSSIASAPDGKQVLLGVSEGNRLAIFDRKPATGKLSLVSTVKQDPVHDLNGVNGVQSIAFADKGRFLATASLTGGISLFTRDEVERKPIFEQVFFGDGIGGENRVARPKLRVVPHLKNPVAVAFLPDDSGLLAASSPDSAVHAFRFDPDVPELKWIGCVREGDNGITGLANIRDFAISPDGKFLYVSAGHAAVSVFELKL